MDPQKVPTIMHIIYENPEGQKQQGLCYTTTHQFLSITTYIKVLNTMIKP